MSPRTLLLLSPFALAVLIGLAVPNPTEPVVDEDGAITRFSMDRYLWEDRPLLLFSPSPADPNYQHACNTLGRAAEALADRKVVVIEAVAMGISRAGGRELPHDSALGLREAFGAAPDAFTIVLVGKDGAELARWHKLPELADLFATIDAPPTQAQDLHASTAVEGR